MNEELAEWVNELDLDGIGKSAKAFLVELKKSIEHDPDPGTIQLLAQLHGVMYYLHNIDTMEDYRNHGVGNIFYEITSHCNNVMFEKYKQKTSN